ncbi:hypothetical protein B0T14DRAFT_427526 [Immersiella caudata]|uniref:DUF4211 domain-containing protein n=1 Tax=Immersiella caudata TaxID=314043 RepID=A0AA39WX77_9PEZI|nr:hypothetical protein B0T14DRAFT_427526 [Immersiella caudata]
MESEEEAEEADKVDAGSSDEEQEAMPLRRGTTTPWKRSIRDVASSSQPVRLDATSEDSDEERLVTPISGERSLKKRKIVFDDSDDQALVSSTVKKRRLVRRKDSVPVVNLVEEEEDEAPRSSFVKRGARKPKTEKERAREFLRRKRAGEVIDEEDEEESDEEEEQEKRALYDSDGDSGLVALQEFDDDEEGIPEPAEAVKTKKGQRSKKKKKSRGTEEDGILVSSAESDLDDFVVEDEDAPLGVPAEMLDIPLQFTSHSHKPMKDHFRDVVEWCVQYKINPGFADKKHELYRMAWQKLDDEVGGLAQSKFLSSSWKRDFVMALRARPEMVYTEEKDRALVPKDCEACGRSGHPAGFRVQFIGLPYFKRFSNDKFLEPVEVDTSNSEGDDEEVDEDEDGNYIPKTTTQFDVGVVCHANAKTAHMLIHWKIGLLNFVIYELTQSGYMNSTQLEKRERMTPKKKHKLVDKILDDWEARGTIKSLYREFQSNVDRARSSTTTGRFGRRG